MNAEKYKAFNTIALNNRKWPQAVITEAPIWCSVDLRDGNQALETPMDMDEKLEFFKFLINTGFKEIEVGFPAASATEYEFTRAIIEGGLIPEDVTIQVLSQCREDILEKTFEALGGADRAIVHFYNSTSAVQRDVVFGKDKDGIKKMAADGARAVKRLAKAHGEGRFLFEYSPESFTGTEPDYAAEVVNAVAEVINPSKDRKLIVNLPSTVEMATANVYADQVEYVISRLNNREALTISLHAHNDRGTGVASTELALMAGAQRVEGTLFGNGERTGNADILTLALNMYTQGIDPKLDFSNIDETTGIYERLVKLPVHQRHPYAGSLVYTAFSGSHQDAISKAMARREEVSNRSAAPPVWNIPYLPIDPKDLGRDYEPIIRINSQSGKGGVAYILKTGFGVDMPPDFRKHFGATATGVSDKKSAPLSPDEIYALFKETYVNLGDPIDLISYAENMNGTCLVHAKLLKGGDELEISGEGDGVVEAFANALRSLLGVNFEVSAYVQHALERGTKSKAITYIIMNGSSGGRSLGCGMSSSVTKSSLRAVLSAVNKILTT